MGMLHSKKLDLEELHQSPLEPSAAVNDFAFHLFRILAQSSDDGNVFFSPMSLYTTLGMVAAGTTAGGRAEVELGGLLRTHFHDAKQRSAALAAIEHATSKGAGVEYQTANSIWSRFDIREDYRSAIVSAFKATSEPLTTEKAINDWVAASTHGKIPSIIDTLPGNTVCVLANAIYFKADWTHKFKATSTAPGKFLVAGKAQKCQMMSQTHQFPYGTDGKNFKMVCLPYGADQKTSMAIIMPFRDSADALDDLLAAFDNEHWNGWLGKLASTNINLKLPKFKVEGDMAVSEQLKTLGVETPFLENNFHRMSDNPLVYLSEVLHKAVIEVDEEGTVAAAASAAVMLERSFHMPQEAVDFVVDRPFIAAIIDNESLMITFMGKVSKPTFL